MPFNNFATRNFTEEEKEAVNKAMKDLELALAEKTANLTPEERIQYGSVNEQNKLIINKVRDFRTVQPELSSPDVDWEEFERDYDTRAFIQNTIQCLQSLATGLNNSKILHDWDNYQASLADYEYSRYKNNMATAAGYEVKVNELKQFFSCTGTGGNTSEEPK